MAGALCGAIRTEGDRRAQPRLRYVALVPEASLLRRLLRCRPSSTNSTAAATAAGDSSPAVRRPPALRSAGTCSTRRGSAAQAAAPPVGAPGAPPEAPVNPRHPPRGTTPLQTV